MISPLIGLELVITGILHLPKCIMHLPFFNKPQPTLSILILGFPSFSRSCSPFSFFSSYSASLNPFSSSSSLSPPTSNLLKIAQSTPTLPHIDFNTVGNRSLEPTEPPIEEKSKKSLHCCWNCGSKKTLHCSWNSRGCSKVKAFYAAS